MTASMFHCEMAWLGGDRAEENVLVEVADGVITAVSSRTPGPPAATRLPGLTLPGFANAHSHAFHRALRSRTHTGGGTFWTWREQMYSLARVLNPDTYFRLARATFAEMAMAGITCVGEFHYLHHDTGGAPYSHPNAMGEAMIAAAGEAGIRITLLDTCYLDGGFGAGLNDVQQRFSDGDADNWSRRVDGLAAESHARIGAAVHSVRAVDPASIGRVAAWADARGAPLHAHVSEQPAENEQCRAAYGATPMQVLADHGALTGRFSAVHATHLQPADVGMLAAHRCTVCMCPTTERDLADGIGPTRELREAGVVISLGSDSHAVIDLFEEARAVELDERLLTLARGSHPVATLLHAATAAGHASLGWDDAGRIAVGAVADLVSIRLDSVRLAGTTVGSALAAAVYSASAADVHHVVVGGRVVVRDQRHVSLDVVRELGESMADIR